MSVIREILLLGHTHHDVGYTNSPRLIDRAHTDIVDRILELCEEGPADGPDAFRWTFEVARPVLRWLKRAEDGDRERLRSLVAQGRVAVTGGYLNMTQLPSEAEQDTAYDQLAAIREAGLELRTEQHGDVNGLSWGSVEGMRRAGIERLFMALNPDHGRPPLTQPSAFWWEGISGERVFTWLSTHYGVGEEWGLVDGDVTLAEQRVTSFIAELEARDDYPFDLAVVHAGNDNRWPTADFLKVVRQWNAVHPERPMRTVTVDQALDLLQEQAASAELPVLRGEWSDWWSHGHGSTAREVAVYREARSFRRAGAAALALESLRGGSTPELGTVLGYRRLPSRLRSAEQISADLESVDESLLLFGEHTWGSWETYSRPFSTLSHSSFNAKAAFAYEAYDLARDLAIEGLARLVGSADGGEGAAEDTDAGAQATAVPPVPNSIVVINPSARQRTEAVDVEVAIGQRRRAVVTAPPFAVVQVPVPAEPAVRVVSGADASVETSRYRAVVDPRRGGITSLIDLRAGRELVDSAHGHGLGAVVAEVPSESARHPMLEGDFKSFHPDHPGPDLDRLVATGDGEVEVLERADLTALRWRTEVDGISAITTLTLYRDSDLVDLEVDLVKPERFGPESIFVAFPFAVGDPEFLLETAGAVYAADREQLPDTSKDWYSIQHALGVTGDGCGVLWGSYDAPLVQLGDFHTGSWARELQANGGQVNSWLMNNLHFTNFQARQEGTRRYRYRFGSRPEGIDHAEVARFGQELAEPLQARAWRGPVRLRGEAGLQLVGGQGLITELEPLSMGGARLRLRNPGARPVTTDVRWTGPGDLAGTGEVLVPAHGRTDVTLERR